MATPEFPNPYGVHSPEDHWAMAVGFIDHADLESAKGRRLQSSDGAWRAVTHELPAIAEEGGWRHEHQHQSREMACHVGSVYNQPELTDRLKLAEANHVSFHHKSESTPEIRPALPTARQLIDGSEDLRQRPMRPFTITDSEERGIARGLSVEEYAVGTTRSIHEGRLWVRSSPGGSEQVR